MYDIVVPFFPSGLDSRFNIVQVGSGTQVGVITNKWTGIIQDMFTDQDIFGVNSMQPVDPKLKMVIIGAIFLIDFRFFEKDNQRNEKKPSQTNLSGQINI